MSPACLCNKSRLLEASNRWHTYGTESVHWSSAGHATTVQSVTIYTVHVYTQLTKTSSYVYSNTTLVHTAFFKPTVMKLLVEWKKSLFEWYYWRSSCEVPNHVDRHAVHWEDKAMIMMSLDYHHHHRIVQQGQGEGRVHNFTEDGDVTGDVSD